jgi:hypothetical protein
MADAILAVESGLLTTATRSNSPRLQQARDGGRA